MRRRRYTFLDLVAVGLGASLGTRLVRDQKWAEATAAWLRRHDLA